MITYIRKLKQFTVSKVLPQQRNQSNDKMAFRLLGVNQTSGKQIISRQHGYLIIKDGIYG